jgi:uncharacterized delta-60 repeat protein
MKPNSPQNSVPDCSPLEERILYSASPLGALLGDGSGDAIEEAELPPSIADALASLDDVLEIQVDAGDNLKSEVVFIDASVDNYELLVDDIRESSHHDIEIVLLEDNVDGITAITDALRGRSNIDSVHILSHGSDGSVSLGNTQLSTDTIELYASELAQWGSSLSADADLLFYGCELAATDTGESLVDEIGMLTGADVAASSDLTGSASLGGDWDFEYVVGDVRSSLSFIEEVRPTWEGVLATFTVTTTDDAGTGSLREAIDQANATAGADAIAFNISGTGVHTITLSTLLPEITEQVTIDATTDDSWAANGNAPAIIIDGNGLTGHGLVFQSAAAGSSVQGFVIRDFDGNAITVHGDADNLTIQGNYLGSLEADGSDAGADDENTGHGIYIASANNTIGGTSSTTRNIVSGNQSDGIRIENWSGFGASGNDVIGNYIGTDVTGTVAIGNGNSGIGIFGGADNNTIGTDLDGSDDALEGNLISGSTNAGIQIWDADSNTIRGNLIGVDATGTTLVGNSNMGIQLSGGSSFTVVGGTSAVAANVIGGTNWSGINLTTAGTSNNTIEGNFLGTDASQSYHLGNLGMGIFIENEASDNTIGGTSAGTGNVIAFSGQDGIGVSDSGTNTTTGNALLQNAIYGSGDLGIDLGIDGFSPNDAGDGDTGANHLQNWPILRSISINDAGQLEYEVDSTTLISGTYTIDFFASRDRDGGQVEGERFIGSGGFLPWGNSSYSSVIGGVTLATGEYVTALVTDGSGNTSEFSNYAVATDGDPGGTLPSDLQTTATTEGGLSLNHDGGDNANLVIESDGSSTSIGNLLGGLNTFSVELDFAFADANRQTLLSYAATEPDGNDFFIRVGESGGFGYIEVILNGTSNQIIAVAEDYDFLLDGNRHQIAFTWDDSGSNGDWSLYVDGTERESGSGFAVGETFAGNAETGSLMFGQEQDVLNGGFHTNDTFRGTYFDARLFSSVRNATEIVASHRTDLPFDEPNMIANWQFDQLSQDGSVLDSVNANNLQSQQVTAAGFTASVPELTFSLDENAPDGTIVGQVAGVDAERDAQIASLLAANPNLHYRAETGKFYEYVDTGMDWATAISNATSSDLSGVSGNLLSIQSATENQIAVDILNRHGESQAWLAAADESIEGEWRWYDGGSPDQLFWRGDGNGYNVDGAYENWDASNPNNNLNDQHYAKIFASSGKWDDVDGTASQKSIIEYDADAVLDFADALIYTIESQTINTAFAIDADTGEIRVLDGSLLDFEGGASRTLTIRATDGDGNFHDEDFTVLLNDLAENNNPPTNLSSGIELNTDGGNDAYFEASNGSAVFNNLTAVTFEASFQVENPNSSDNAIISYANGLQHNEFYLTINNDGQLWLGIDSIGTGELGSVGRYTELLDGGLHHLAVTWDSTNGSVAFYVDGELAEAPLTYKQGATIGTGGTLQFGQDQDLTGYESDQAFSGTFYDLRIWDEVRSEADIALNSQNKFDSGSLPTGLIANWQMDGFDGSDEIVDVVSGNNLSIGHASGTGFTASIPAEDLHVYENANNGTSVGFVVPSDPDAQNDIVRDGLLTEGLPSGSTQLFGTSSTFGAWTVESGAVESLGGWMSPGPLGGVPLELSAGSLGTIRQTLDTDVGQTYQITFALNGDWSAGADVKELRVSAGGESHDFQIEQPADWTSTNPRWEHRTLTFTATDTTTDLRFSSLDVSSIFQASVITDVQVTEISAAVNTILNSDSTLSYDAASGKFYRIVSSPTSWTSAQANASSDLLNGTTGNLATIRSGSENSFLRNLLQAHAVSGAWIGGSDSTVEGTWTWQDGSEDTYYTGGAAAPGAYENFGALEPSGGAAENHAELVAFDGTWNDLDGASSRSYIVEWDASEVLSGFTFSLTDDAGGRFAIDSSTGEITVTDGDRIDYETSTSHSVTVDVTDAAGNTSSEAIVIAVVDAIELDSAPTDLSSGIELNFDGGNAAYLATTDANFLLGAEGHTYEVRFSDLTSVDSMATLYSHRDPGAAQSYLAIHADGTLDWAGLTSVGKYTELLDGGIHSLAVSWDASTGHISFFVDGEYAESTSVPSQAGSTGGTTFVIGQHVDFADGSIDPSEAFSGTFHDFRIWDHARSEAEVALAYQHKLDSGSLPSGLIANWQMDGFNGSDEIVDIVSGNNLTVESAGLTKITGWTNQVGGVTANGDTLTYIDDGAPDGWGSQINSPNLSTLGYSDDYTIRFTVDNETNNAWTVGLGSVESSVNHLDPEFAIFHDYVSGVDSVSIRHNGVNMGSYNVGMTAGGEFGFYINGTTLEYQYNGVTFATDTIPAATDWYVDSSFYVRTVDSTYDNQDDYSLSNFHVVDGNDVLTPGFRASTPVGDLNIDENSADGTSVGYVVPSVPDAPQDVAQDGSFTHAGATGYVNVGIGQTIGGAGGSWTVVSGDVDLEGGWADSPLGGTALGLDGTTPGAIAQTLTTEAGRQYQVVFALTGNFQSTDTSYDLRLSAAGVSEDFTTTEPSGWSPTNLLWEHRSFNFTATGPTTDIQFASLSDSGGYGAVIGDVQIIEISQNISTVLQADASLSYDAATGKFYRIVTSASDFDTALAAATGSHLNGLSGQLVTIGSAHENDLIRQFAIDSGLPLWLGARDTNNDGNWNWLDGNVESNEQFWTGGNGGSATAGFYAPTFGQSEALFEDYARIDIDGTWADDTPTSSHAYVVEWDASEVLSSFTFSLTDDAGGRFAIDSSTGEVSVVDGSLLDHETDVSHSITVEVTDAGGNTYGEAMSISVNNLFEIEQTVPGAQAVEIDTPLIFSAANGNALTVSDTVASEDTRLQVYISTSFNGTLTLSQTTGLYIGGGSNGGTFMTIQGTESDINAALEGMTFTPANGYSGPVTISMTTSLGADLAGRYAFEGDANDTGLGGVQHGVFNGEATTVTDGTRGEVLSLDGNGDSVEITGMFGNPANLTLAAWVNPNLSGHEEVISLGDNVAIRVQSDGSLRAFYYDSGGIAFLDSEAGAIPAGNWSHVAFVFDDSNDLVRLFVNGTETASDSETDSISYSRGTNTFIGAHGFGNSSFDFDGLIDDARIYERALSAGEINALAAEQTEVNDTIAIVVADFAVPVAVADTENTSEETPLVIDPTANDTDADGHTISIVEFTQPANGSVIDNGDGTLTYTPDANFTGVDSFDYIAADSGLGLQHHWSLEGTAVDAVGGNHGAVTGASPTAGEFGNGLEFDEVNDYITIPDVTYNNDFSISFEFKVDDTDGSLFQYLYSHGDVNNTNSINIFINENLHGSDPNVLRTVVRDGNDTLDNTALQVNIASLVGDGQFHTYTLTANASGAQVYLDGVLVASDASRGTDGVNPIGNLYLGARQDLDADRRFGGVLDSVQVFSTALNDTQINDLETLVNRATVNITVGDTNDAPTFFAGDGSTVTSLATQFDSATDVAIQPDGKYLVSSSANTAATGQDIDFAISRYNADGSLDTSFGTDGTVTTAVNTGNEAPGRMALQDDGKIVVIGAYDDGGVDSIILRYDSDGTLDTTFSGDGMQEVNFSISGSDYFEDVVIQPDGKIVVVGYGNFSGLEQMTIARFNANGSLDNTFGSSGQATLAVDVDDERATAVALQSDGKIVIAGQSNNGSNNDIAVRRLNTDGSLDTTFGTAGIVGIDIAASGDSGTAVLVDGADNIFVAGTGNQDSVVMRLDSSGSLDASFGTAGIATVATGSPFEAVNDMQIQADGKLVVVGNAYNGSNNNVSVFRLNTDGTLDGTFGTGGTLTTAIGPGTDSASAVAVDNDGSLIVVGRSDNISGDSFIARYDGAGNLDTRFDLVNTLDGNPTFTEGGSPVVLDADAQVFDQELTGINDFGGASLTVVRSSGANSEDVFSVQNPTAFVGGNVELSSVAVGTYTNSGGMLTITFNAGTTNAQVNTVMQSIAYENTNSSPPMNVQLAWTFDDGNSGSQGTGGALQAIGSTTVNILDPSELAITAPVASLTDEDIAFVFSGANVIQVNDGLAADTPLRVELSVANGTLSLANLTGVAFVEGADGWSTMIVEGLESDLNSAFDGLTFTPDANYNGADTLNIKTSIGASLSGHYSFESATISGLTVNDQAAGTEYDGMLNGNAAIVNDVERGDVLSLDGNGDFVQINGLMGEPADVTLAAWVDVNSLDNSGAVVISMGTSPALYFDSAGQLLGFYESGGSNYIATFSGGLIGTGWNHVAMTIDSTSQELTLFVNGVVVETIAATTPIEYDNSPNTYIGRAGDGLGGFDFGGQIDEARVYSRALSPEEIAALATDQAEATVSVAITVDSVNDAPTFYIPVTPNFTENTIDAAADGASSVTAADVDGDGDLDLLSASFHGDTITWYENDGSENFTTRTITTSANGARSVTTADVDGDGDLDVVAASSYDDTIAWYENDGSENFTARTISTTADGAISVTAADVDGDGDLDVVAASNNDDTIRWYENDGSQNFSERIITTNADQAFSVTTADVDGDGDLDVLSASAFDNKIAWYENDGSENFTARTITTSATGARSVSTADVDGDGDLDVLSASFQDSTIAWYENDGNENFTVRTITNLALGANSVSTADVDGDGDLDVLSTSFSDDTIAWYENDGSQAFTTHTLTTNADGAYAVTTGDVDGDGDLDVLSAVFSGDSIAWFENDGGLFNTLDGNPTYIEGGLGNAVQLDADVQIFDAELSAIDDFGGATLALSRNGGGNTDDVFSGSGNVAFVGTTLELSNVTIGSVVQFNGFLIIAFDGGVTNAQVNEVMQSIAYSNTSDSPPSSVQIEWAFEDGNFGSQGTGGSIQAVGRTTVNITTTNDAPVLDLDADDSSGALGSNFSTGFLEGGGPVLLVDADGMLTDADSATLTSILVTHTNVQDSGNELLAADTTGTSLTASWDGGTEILTISGIGTVADYQMVLRTVTYENTSVSPDTATDRVITFIANDGTDNSLIATTTVAVSDVNSAPTTGTSNTTGSEDVNSVSIVINGSDADGTVTDFVLNTLPTNGTLYLDTGLTTPVTTGVDYAATGESITLYFSPDTNWNGSTTFEYAAKDNLGLVDPTAATGTFTINAVNDAPVNQLPASQTIAEDGTLVLSLANGNNISINDIDSGSSPIQVTLTATNGILNLATTAGLTVTGDGTGTVTLTGSNASIFTALDGLTFLPTTNYNGPATITVATDDLGNSGTGGPLTDSDVLTINVTPVNDAPSGTDNTYIIPEDGSHTFAPADFGFSDGVDGDALLAVTISSLPTNGVLELNGLSVTAGQSIAQGDIANLVYSPNVNVNGVGADSFTFQVQDDGGITNGGTDVDPVANRLTFDITAVNDAPVNVAPGTQYIAADTGLAFTSANGNAISIADTDAGVNQIEVTLTATDGTITLGGTTGLSFVSGTGVADSSVTFNGTLSDINNALEGLMFQPTNGFSGSATLLINTDDLGNTGAGGNLTDADIVSIEVYGANATLEDTPAVFSVANGNEFTVTDGSANDGQVRVTLSVTSGVLNLSSTAGLTFDSGSDGSNAMTIVGLESQVNAALDGLVFTPTSNFNGTANLQIATESLGTLAVLAGDYNDYTVGESAFTATNAIISDASNFGPTGTFSQSITVLPTTTTVNAAYLAQGEVLFDGFVGDAAYDAVELADITNWVQSGGVLISTNDDPSFDPLAAHFGMPVVGVGSTVWNIAEDTNTMIDGPFGQVGVTGQTIEAAGSIGYFSSGNLIAGDVVIATDSGSGEPTIVLRQEGAGWILFMADEGPFRASNMTGGGIVATPNDILAANIFAWAANNTSVAPSPSIQSHDIQVIAVNDAPVLDNTGIHSLPTISEDATNTAGDTVANLIASAGGDSITDVDLGATEGIGIYNADSSNGDWEYSIDGGTSWNGFGSPSPTAALLLSENAMIRFEPNADFHGDATFSYVAWDQTVGVEGDTLQLAGHTGGSGTFSTGLDTAFVTVQPVNDAPTIVTNSFSITEGGTHPVTSVEINSNDLDDSNPTLAYTASGVSGGQFELTTNPGVAITNWLKATMDAGEVVFVHDGNEAAPTFDITVADDDGASVTVSGNIVFTNVNDAPVGVNDTYVVAEGGSVSIDALTGVLANDVDVDGDSLAVSILAGPGNGSVILNADGSFDYTHDGSETTSDSFTYTVTDGNGGSATATVAITISPVNDDPFNASGLPASVTTTEDLASDVDLSLFDLADLDANGNNLTVTLATSSGGTLSSVDAGGVTVGGSGTAALTLNGDLVSLNSFLDDPSNVQYTGTFNTSGNNVDSILVSVTDHGNTGTGGGGTIAIGVVNVNVTNVNDAPAGVNDNYVLAEGATLNIAAPGVTGNDTDVDGDALTATLVSSPTNGTIILNPDGSFDYTHDGSETISDSFTYQVADGNGGFDVATVNLTINPVNDAPDAIADAYTVAEGATLSIAAPTGVSSNDTDAEGDSLVATVLSGPAHGTLTLNADGSFDYTHDGSETSGDSFTYQIADGSGGFDTGTVNLSVTRVNDAPVATGEFHTVLEGDSLTIAAPGVLANDSDAEGDLLSATVVTAPTHGLLLLNPDGSFTYTHDGSETTSDSFVYQVSDGNGGFDTATVSLTVLPTNDAPVAVSDSYVLDEGGTLNVAATGLLANDNDADGDALVVTLVNGPTNGTLTLNTDGSFTYTHDGSETTADGFSYRITDSSDSSDVTTVNLVIQPMNDVPVATGENYTVSEGGSLNENAPGLLQNEFDSESDSLSASMLTGPTNGTVTINSDGSFAYVHDGSETTSDSFTYQVDDGNGGIANATVLIDVTPANDVPIARQDDFTLNEGATITINAPGVLANDTDVDGDPLTVVLIEGPTHGSLTLNPNGSFSYTHNGSESLTDSFRYAVDDGNGGSDTALVNLTIQPVNDAPVAGQDTYSVAEGGTLNVTSANGVLANDTDIEGDLLATALIAGPTNGTLSFNADGSFTYSHDGGDTTTDAFTYQVSDGNGGVATGTVTVNIGSINDAPTTTGPGPQSTLEDVPLVLSIANGNALTVADSDAGTNPVIVTLSSTNGRVSLSTTAALTFANGNGIDDGQVTFVGTVSDINAALDGLVFTPDQDFHGQASIDLLIDDQGNFGTGGNQTAQVGVSINVDSVNDAPVAVDDAFDLTPGQPAVLIPTNILLNNDSDVDGDTLSILIDRAPISGNVIVATDGTLIYTPELGYFGTDSFTYWVFDSSGVGDLATVTIEVVPVAPAGSSFTNENQNFDSNSNDGGDGSEDNATLETIAAPVLTTSTTNQGVVATGRETQQDTSPTASASPTNRDAILGDVVLADLNAGNGVVTNLVGDRFGETSTPVLGRPVDIASVNAAAFDQYFWTSLESISDQVETGEIPTIFSYAFGGAGAAASLGYLIWSVRSGYFFASLMASMPVWSRIDPLPVVDFAMAKGAQRHPRRKQTSKGLIESLSSELQNAT